MRGPPPPRQSHIIDWFAISKSTLHNAILLKAMAAYTSSQHNNFAGFIHNEGGLAFAGNTFNAPGGSIHVNSMSSGISSDDRKIQYIFA